MKQKKTVSTKSQPAKRKYTKRSNPVYDELDQLALVCQVIESWSDEQKERNLRFIYSKYSNHFQK